MLRPHWRMVIVYSMGGVVWSIGMGICLCLDRGYLMCMGMIVMVVLFVMILF